MKTTKKLLSILLAMVMLFTLALPAFAQDAAVTPSQGSNTLTVNGPAKGVTYKLYKLFDAQIVGEGEDAAVSYTLPAGKTLDENDPFKVEAGHVVWADGTDVPENLTPGAIKWIEETATNGFATEVASVVSDGTNIKFTGLADGYYFLVKDTETTSKISVTTLSPNPVINDKNTSEPGKPDDRDQLKKVQITKEDGTTVELTNKITAEVGEAVTFNVAFNTVNYETEKVTEGEVEKEVIKPVTEYTIHDVATNMDVDFNAAKTELKIDVDGTTIANYTISQDGKTITIPWYNADTKTPLYANGVKVTVTYKGFITEGAINETATNKAEVGRKTDGTNKPINPDDPGVEVYTGKAIITKVDQEGAALEGAKFVLKNSEGKYYKYVAATSDEPAKVTWVDLKDADVETSTKDTNGDAIVVFDGLKAGDYVLVETEAPNGYNKLDDELEVNIIVNDQFSGYVVDFEDTVVNNRGTVLPSTGGIGTTIFYVVGGLLVLGAAVVLVSKKRMGNQQ